MLVAVGDVDADSHRRTLALRVVPTRLVVPDPALLGRRLRVPRGESSHSSWRPVRSLPERLRPGIGLRPGWERRNLEELVVALYAALDESIAARLAEGPGTAFASLARGQGE